MEDPTVRDAFHRALAHHRRRTALACLVDNETAGAVADLAEDVAEREHNTAITEIPDDEVQQIHLTLYHIHLPKLAEAGLIDYDWRSSTVRYRDHPRVEEWLRIREELDTAP